MSFLSNFSTGRGRGLFHIGLISSSLIATNSSVRGVAPDVFWAPYLSARVFAVDEQTNVYAHSGGTVYRLTAGLVPYQTNVISPWVGDFARRDAAGNFYFVGQSTGAHDFGGGVILSNGPYVIAKYTDTGTLVWAHDFGSQPGGFYPNLTRVLNDFAVDPVTGVSFTSYTEHLNSYRTTSMIKFDAAGLQAWANSFNDYNNDAAVRFGPVADGGGYAILSVVWSYQSSGTLFRFDTSGNISSLSSWGVPWTAGTPYPYDRPVINSAGELCAMEGGTLTRHTLDGALLSSRSLGSNAVGVVGPDQFGGVHVGANNGPIYHFDYDGNTTWSFPWMPAPVNAFILDTSGNRFFSLTSGAIGRIGSEVVSSPVITNSPQSQTTLSGSNVDMAVGAAGSAPLRYFWRFNNAFVPDATNSTLGLSSVTTAQSGSYSVIVSNFVGSITSAPAVLRVKQVELFLGNQLLTNGVYTFATPPTLNIRSSFTNGSFFYTLDGSTPTFSSTSYSGPFVVSNTATVRALGYSADFSQSEQADAVNVVVLTNHTLAAFTAGGGSVSLNPPGGTYPSTSNVTVTATPASGWSFLYWLGAASGTNPVVSVSMETDKSVQAVFGTTVSTTASGNGQVQVYPPSGPYPYGSVVRLTGIPQPGNSFAIWGNAASGNTNPLYFAVTSANPTVSSLFAATPAGDASLTILISGRGQVNTSPRANHYPTNQVVTLTAVPDSGQSFLRWSGDASGTQNPLSVLMSQDKIISASFSSPASLVINQATGDGFSTQGFRFTLSGDPQFAWQIMGSSNLANWEVLGQVSNALGQVQFTDPAAINHSVRFYRAALLP